MCMGFPVPDFDFDETPLISLDQPIAISTPCGLTSDLKHVCEAAGFMITKKNPLWCTSNSTVYVATDGRTKDFYALKVSKYKNRIFDEFQKRQLLPESPYLAKSIGIFEDPAHAILQMELCENGDIAGAKMNEIQLWKLIHDVASGLAIIHNNGWMHLDISPYNILCAGNTYKIADFGTLVQIGQFECGCEGAGPYVSPETMACNGGTGPSQILVGTASDIFSFGVVLLELASQYYAPRGGDNGYQLLRKGEIRLGDDLYKCDFSPDLIGTVNSMLNPDPFQRPTALDLVHHSRAV